MAKKVLVVDDSPTVRQQVTLALRQAGYDTVEACDGLEGTKKLDATVGMVICDVNMPRMNGIEMLEAIKREGKHTGVPVVMLTTEGHPALIERAKKAGVKGWIVKPFKADQLVAAVAKLVR
jgi:two-component system chemotaxis response regulator CheY